MTEQSDADLIKELHDRADHERSHGRKSGLLWMAATRLATLSVRVRELERKSHD